MLMIEDSSEENGTGNAVHHITFRNNIFLGARAFAIQGGGADHFTFVNNLVADSNYGAFGLSSNPYLTVANNIFYNNGSGSQINDNESKSAQSGITTCTTPISPGRPSSPSSTCTACSGSTRAFAAPGRVTIACALTSPAIDRGMALPGFNYDKDLVYRPQIAAWDIGPYEAIPELELGRPRGRGDPPQLDGQRHLATHQHLDNRLRRNPWRPASPHHRYPRKTRAYALTGLENYTWYTVTLSTDPPLLTDMVTVMPTDRLVFLPIVVQ